MSKMQMFKSHERSVERSLDELYNDDAERADAEVFGQLQPRETVIGVREHAVHVLQAQAGVVQREPPRFSRRSRPCRDERGGWWCDSICCQYAGRAYSSGARAKCACCRRVFRPGAERAAAFTVSW